MIQKNRNIENTNEKTKTFTFELKRNKKTKKELSCFSLSNQKDNKLTVDFYSKLTA